MRVLFLSCRALLACFLLTTALAVAEPFPAVGSWRLSHGDGSPLYVEVYPNGRAHSDYEANNPGRWLWKGQELHLEWADGWVDVIEWHFGVHLKSARAPGSNKTGAKKRVLYMDSIPGGWFDS